MRSSLGIVAVLAVAFSLRPEPVAAPQESVPEQSIVSPPAEDKQGIGAQLLARHYQDPSDSNGEPVLQPGHPAPRVLIATVPDPLGSHLDWAYDSHVDAIRRAFERAGFVLEQFQIPWERNEKHDPTEPATPGALLFRRTAKQQMDKDRPAQDAHAWLVYLVAELSTTGVDHANFARALGERAKLLGPELAASEPVLVVGPVFSGSSGSLIRALAAAGSCEVITGSATSPENAKLFANAKLSYRSTLHADDVLLPVLKDQILVGGLGLSPSEIAILRESSTDYGQAAVAPDEDQVEVAPEKDQAAIARNDEPVEVAQPWSIPFPMSIGALRQAFREETAAAKAEPGARVPRSNVEFDVYAEPQRAETALTASKLTPASIDLLLEGITRSLAERDIRAVVILASDVRDKLFLGAELKKRLPDLQLATTEGNVLYLRPEYNRWLRGMIVVSTYPLFLRHSGGRPQSSTEHEQLMFPNEGAEGTFNAVLLQLHEPDLLTDYGLPFLPIDAKEGEEQPPVWATVVGGQTMLPLSVRASKASSPGVPTAADTNTPLALEHPRASGSTFLVQLGVSVGSLLLLCVIAVHLRADLTRRGLSSRILRALPRSTGPSWQARQDRLERVSLALHHELYLVFLLASLWCLLLPNVLLLARPKLWSYDSMLLARLLGYAAIVAGALAILHRAWLAACILAEHWKPALHHLLDRSTWPSRRLRREWFFEGVFRALVVLCALFYLALTIGLCFEIFGLSRAPSEPSAFPLFFQRAIAIDQGVSPLLPLALIAAIAIAWSSWHLARIRALALRVPGESILRSAASSRAAARFLASETRQRLFRIVPTTAGFAWLCAVTAAGLTLAFRFGKTLDGSVLARDTWRSSFDGLLCLGILGALGGSIWAGYRLLSVWEAFRKDLHANEILLSGLPFKAIEEQSGVRANLGLWPSGHVRNLPQIARQAWLSLDQALADAPPGLRAPWSPAAIQRVARRRERPRLEADPEAVRMLTSLTARLRADPQPAKQSDPALQARERWRGAANEVVALELLLYVEWVFGQLRRLSFFLLLSLVLITLLITSYPYHPQQLVQTLSLFVFAAMVVGLVGLIGAMSRNAQLSTMTVAPPGEVTWDRTLFANLALYALVPLLALISTQYSGLRETLFDWLKPLVTFLVKA